MLLHVYLCAYTLLSQMDPTKLKPNENVEENAQHLHSLAQNVFDRILASIDSCPRFIRLLLTTFY